MNRKEPASIVGTANAFAIAAAAPSTIRTAEAAALGKAASVAVGVAAPVFQMRAQAAAGARQPVATAVGVGVHVAHPWIFDAVKGDGVLVVVMAVVGGAVAGAGGLVAHGRGEDVALRVDAVGAWREGWQG
jgi:hypothetical protein